MKFPEYKWETWFAWYPVAFGSHIAWLRKIQRRRVIDKFHLLGYWMFRNIPYTRQMDYKAQIRMMRRLRGPKT